MRPIPAEMLTDTVTLEKYRHDIGGRELVFSTMLSSVRIVRCREKEHEHGCGGDGAKGILYFDARHSRPSGAELLTAGLESDIVQGSDRCGIRSVKYLYDERGFHHAEAELV